jgi:hypothetical protein
MVADRRNTELNYESTGAAEEAATQAAQSLATPEAKRQKTGNAGQGIAAQKEAAGTDGAGAGSGAVGIAALLRLQAKKKNWDAAARQEEGSGDSRQENDSTRCASVARVHDPWL